MSTTPSPNSDQDAFTDSYPPRQTYVSSPTDSPFAPVTTDLDLDLGDFPKPPTTLGDPTYSAFKYTPKWMLKSPQTGHRKQMGATGLSELAEEDEFECPLCLDNDENVASLPCGHVFGVE